MISIKDLERRCYHVPRPRISIGDLAYLALRHVQDVYSGTPHSSQWRYFTIIGRYLNILQILPFQLRRDCKIAEIWTLVVQKRGQHVGLSPSRFFSCMNDCEP